MTRRMKLMAGLPTLAAACMLLLSGCGGADQGKNGETEAGPVEPSAADVVETGEDSAAAAAEREQAARDIAYMKLLGEMRGDLIAFLELYQGDARDMALKHARHPEDDIYAALVPAFEERGQSGFADELNALADAAKAGGDIDDAYSAVVEAIAAHMPNASVASKMIAIAGLVNTAAAEFEAGVGEDGAIADAQSYQRAYGCLIAARDMLAGIDTNDMNASDAISLAHEQIEIALTAFDGGLTADRTDGLPSTLFEASSRIDSAARRLT